MSNKDTTATPQSACDSRKKLRKQKSQSASNLTELTIDVIDPASIGPNSFYPDGAAPHSPNDTRQKVFQKLSRYLRTGSNVSTAYTLPKPPQVAISTKSLPDSLNSENENQPNGNHHSDQNGIDMSRRTGHSLCEPYGYEPEVTIASSKSISYSMRQWKLPKYLRKDSKNNNNTRKCDTEKCILGEVGSGGLKPASGSNHMLLPVIVKSTSPDVFTSCPDSSDHASIVCSVSPCSFYNINNTDIIDVRSYISQSRSDITPYHERSESYKINNSRAACGDVSPMQRPRATTIALTSQEHLCSPKMQTKSNDIGNQLRVPSPQIQKINKDNNQRSQLLQVPSSASMNKTSVSQEGLSICQQSSLVSTASEEPFSAFELGSSSEAVQLPAIKIEHLRKQSDLQLIRCLRDNAKSRHSYLVKPPISKWTLFFRSPVMEKEFRSRAHHIGINTEIPTIATPIYNTFIDIIIGTIIFFTLSTSLFLLAYLYDFHNNSTWWIWLVFFGAFSILEIFALCVFTKRLLSYPNEQEIENETKSKIAMSSMSSESSIDDKQHGIENRLIQCISNWYRWHLVLGILMTLPIILIILQYFLQGMPSNKEDLEYRYGFLMLVCIVHFSNFTQLNCWLRNILSILAAMVFVIGITLNHLGHRLAQLPAQNQTISRGLPLFIARDEQINSNSFDNITNDTLSPHAHGCSIEIYVDLFLVLILVWFLNREFEISYRFSFYGNAIAENDRMRVQAMKNQADILLQNIIPKHVADHLKSTAKYSENHHNVAIIFAGLINFNELYDESYLGGREYLRVLNELIGDFDELLSRPRFQCVEKIKTIGSTFMAASGLDNLYRGDNNDHVNALMEFAFSMQEVVAAFNKDLLEFDLILRIGFNVGDVTAGVIGTSKLHYDIWGDAVNVSSRMDSTGIAGQVQVDKDCIPFLDENLYVFTPRGKVFIKGKGDMEVYLVTKK